MRTIFRITCAIYLMYFFSSCGLENEKPKEVAIIKFSTHPALDELEIGLIKSLKDSILANNLNFKIVSYNAQGKFEQAKHYAELLGNRENVELIITIATPATQAAVSVNSKKLILYGAVADPEGAGLIPSDKVTGIQNAGYNIILSAVQTIRIAFPEAKKLGTIYNSSEQNSLYVQSLLKKAAEENGFILIQKSITGADQIPQSIEYLCKNVDVIYSANDNAVNTNINAVMNICNDLKTPFIIGDLSTIKAGPLLAIGLEYEHLGNELGIMAIRLLKGENIKNVPPQAPPNPQVWFNSSAAGKLNYIPSDSLKNVIDKTIH